MITNRFTDLARFLAGLLASAAVIAGALGLGSLAAATTASAESYQGGVVGDSHNGLAVAQWEGSHNGSARLHWHN